MGGMFSGCNSLISVDLSSFNAQNVRHMEYMFSSCKSLTSVDLSNFNTQNSVNMNEIFYCCSSLVNINLTNFSGSKAKVYHIFKGCNNILSINLITNDTKLLEKFNEEKSNELKNKIYKTK